MSKSILEQIEKASLESIEHPGKSKSKLPKQESKKYPEIYLFRHGETYDNKNKVFSGWRDSSLTHKGIKQAEVLANKLKGKDINLCIVSPLSRSKETAKLALKYHPNMVYEEDERVIERNYGKLMGYSKSKMAKENPVLAAKYRRGYDSPPPKGESLKMVEERVFPFCIELVERIKRNNINVAISAHGNSMRAIRKYFEKLSTIEELTMENPLGSDYCEYVVRLDKFIHDDRSKVYDITQKQKFNFIRKALARFAFVNKKIKSEFQQEVKNE